MWTKRLPSGDGSGTWPTPPPGSPCSRSAGGQDDPVVAVGRQADDLEPAVGVGQEQERAVGQPAGPRRRGCARRRRRASRPSRPRRARSARSRGRPALAHDRDPGAVGRPLEGVDVDARTRSGRSGGAVAARWPVGPGAAPARRSARPGSSRGGATGRRADARRATSVARDPCPAGSTTRVSRDPSASTTQISSSRTNARRRPSGDHCGSEIGFSEAVSWVAVAAAQRQREQLARTGRLGRIGDDAVARVEPELARGVDRDDGLDRQVRRRVIVGAVGISRSICPASLARAPRSDHREVLADVAVEAVVGPAPAVGRAQVVGRQPADGLEQLRPGPVVSTRGSARRDAPCERATIRVVPGIDPFVRVGQPVAEPTEDLDRPDALLGPVGEVARRGRPGPSRASRPVDRSRLVGDGPDEPVEVGRDGRLLGREPGAGRAGRGSATNGSPSAWRRRSSSVHGSMTVRWSR